MSLNLLCRSLNHSQLVKNQRILRRKLSRRLHLLLRHRQIVFLKRGKPSLIVALRRIGFGRLLSFASARSTQRSATAGRNNTRRKRHHRYKHANQSRFPDLAVPSTNLVIELLTV